MSEKRKAFDNYETPLWCVELLLKNHLLLGPNVLEPCAGSGVIVRAVKKFCPDLCVDAVEIREEERDSLKQAADRVVIGNYLKTDLGKKYQTVITNPPYSQAQAIIEKAHKDCYGEVIMLLRLAFLESKKRIKFWKKYPPGKVYVLSERPSFTGKGTDATAYGWFVWTGISSNDVKILSGGDR